jgi:hypothetical protein
VCVSLLISPASCKISLEISIPFHLTWSSCKLHSPAHALLLI